MRTLILCGGKGMRAYPHSLVVPKPLMHVGDRPVLRHVMDCFARQGFTDFVLAAGFMADSVSEFASALPSTWSVEVVDTGDEANTGRRVATCWPGMGPRFFVTYGDGLADVELGRILSFHRRHNGAATMTTVPLPSPYGVVAASSNGRVRAFREKPKLPDHWINGGFFVFEERAIELFEGDDLEREFLPRLSRCGELFAYRHRGFWRSMDTYKDAVELTELAEEPGGPPWTRNGTRAQLDERAEDPGRRHPVPRGNGTTVRDRARGAVPIAGGPSR